MAKPAGKPQQRPQHGPQGDYKRSNDGFVDSERGETQPADKGQAQRSSGDVKPEDQPPSPGQPAGGE
ncbi:MAG TPA: hypothetical protein VFL51_09130 [Pseudolabrys sp.]|nr:hypothetical protein [Pseudolabrys sp.]